jgi:hypothetical protein
MAEKKKAASSTKTTFGKRRVGKHKKFKAPKERASKPYRGQGR